MWGDKRKVGGTANCFRCHWKFDDIFSRLGTIHQQTKRQQRPRLRIASRGKNDQNHISLDSRVTNPFVQ